MLAIEEGAAACPTMAIDVEPDFDFASAEYGAFHNLRRATAFQAPRWLASIHRDLVPRLGGRQHTVTVRHGGDRRLMAVLPLVIQRVGLLSVAQPADFGVCDANAIVADAHVLERLSQDRGLRDRLAGLLRGADILFFRKVRQDGFDVRRLFDGAVTSPCENAAYHSEIGDDFEAWQRRTMNRKTSKELGRLGRQIEREFGRYEHRLVGSEVEIRTAFAFLQSVRKGRFQSDLLDNAIYAHFYREFAVAGAASGDAQTYVSYLDGEPVAVLMCVGCDDECHAVLIGADTTRLSKYSVGMQLLYRVIKLRFDAGRRRLDFGLGNTGYKSVFRVDETLLDNVTLPCSLAGSATSFIYHKSKPLKNVLRKLTPSLR